jgi:hypothetical protein
MRTTVNLHSFRNAFQSVRPDNFTYEGLEQLFDYFESYEDDTGEEIELDVIAICCEYSELSLEDFKTAYSYDIEDTSAMTLDDAFTYLSNQTSVIGRTDITIIFQDF